MQKKYKIPFSKDSYLRAKSAMKDTKGNWKTFSDENFVKAQNFFKILEEADELKIIIFSDKDQEGIAMDNNHFEILAKEIKSLLS